MMKIVAKLLLLLPLFSPLASGFDYNVTKGDDTALALTDEETGIGPVRTVFRDEEILVEVVGVAWKANENGTVSDQDVLLWETFVDNKLQDSGSVSLAAVGRELMSSVKAGSFKVSGRGTHTVMVRLTVDKSSIEVSGDFQAFGAGASIIPLLVVLILAMTTKMVELSLFIAIFVGSCMVTGNINDGFKELLEVYLLESLADMDHGYVILFTLFLSGLVGMLEKSGGMIGFTRNVSVIATGPRMGQFCCFCIGVFIFFDDYANTLLAGETMRPLLDTLFVSREKLAFVVDATAAPIASISPISSWVGYEVDLIQAEIDRIIELEGGEENVSIKTTGLGVFFQSIKYRYYPIFMIILMLALILTGRDYGTMLVAERKTRVYQRTDGGDGKGRGGGEGGGVKVNQPRSDTPALAYNMIIPILLMIFFIFYLLVKTGEDDSDPDQSIMDKIEASNSYAALLWGTMAAAIITLLMYLLQIVQDGHIVMPNGAVLKQMFTFRRKKAKDEDAPDSMPPPRFLMTVYDSVESFLYGMGRIFPALIVLILAWASGAIMKAVGADRLFSRWIVGGIEPESLPTLSFVISFFMALATGTSWGTMSILFPLILVPTYQSSDGDETIFYAVTAGVLSGSVAGDHVSPISDTTVLSALACDCDLVAHVSTQAPYVMVVVAISILLGTIPIGYDAWPNIIGILLGAGLVVGFVYGVCVPVLSPTGRFDFVTELALMWKRRRGIETDLVQIKQDTIRVCQGETVVAAAQSGGGDGGGGGPKEVVKELSSEDDDDDDHYDDKVDETYRDLTTKELNVGEITEDFVVKKEGQGVMSEEMEA